MSTYTVVVTTRSSVTEYACATLKAAMRLRKRELRHALSVVLRVVR